MNSFGDKLKREREDHHTTLEELAGSTGIGLTYLEALEHDQFEDLPGRAFGKLYIRAYAEVLGFDPAPWLADYDRARRDREQVIPPEKWYAKPILVPPTSEAAQAADADPQLEASPEVAEDESDEPHEPVAASPDAPVVAEQVEPEPVELVEVTQQDGGIDEASAVGEVGPTESEVIETRLTEGGTIATPTTPKRILIAAAATVAVIAMVFMLFAMFGSEETDVASDSIAAGSQPATPAGSESDLPTPARPVAQQADDLATAVDTPKQESQPVERQPASTRRLSIGEYGVGRDRRLHNRDDRFVEGEVAWFSTQVIGGRSGDSIEHVWLLEGKRMQTTQLAVGSSQWRTQSYKTLWGAGDWTVEARDSEGRVLATAAFTCTPK